MLGFRTANSALAAAGEAGYRRLHPSACHHDQHTTFFYYHRCWIIMSEPTLHMAVRELTALAIIIDDKEAHVTLRKKASMPE